MSASPLRQAWRVVSVSLLFSSAAAAQNGNLTSPQAALGFTIGDDYMLATYSQLTDWWKKLDAESDRMKLVSIGKTAEGRDQWMAIVTSPANHARLEQYRGIAGRLARAEGLTDEQARALAREGKAVVWIDGGLHATEVLGAHQLMEHVWQMVSRNDEETMRLLDDVIQLMVHANPDGMELVSTWYMRNPDKTRRSTQGIPRLYQKYIGHDNNRDFYLNAQPESENMSRVMYREWYPQIMYNHHQTGPAGTVMFAPPFRDPHNHNIDPILINGLSLVGAAMHTRFAAEAKPGVVMRNAASYQTWWNGGLRTTAYFHNIIGILTETIGNPTPLEIPFIPQRQLSTGDITYPIPPQRWHFRQSIDYSITANRAIVDLASRYREHFLYNIYLMGRNAIARGSQDSWTNFPSRIAAVEEAATRDRANRPAGFGGASSVDRKYYEEYLREPAKRDPRGYIIPSDQPDFPTATRFVNALMKSGVEIHRATAPFTVAGKSYPADSWVIKTAQAFRAHVVDLMEPQDYPNDIPYPGGPPRAPYDNAGYTLAMQMGVRYDRILDGFDGPFAKVTEPLITRTPGGSVASGGGGWVLSSSFNDGVTVANRLVKAGVPVYRLTRALAERPAGSLYIPSNGSARAVLQELADTRGLRFAAAGGAPNASEMVRVRPVRIGLADTYGGSMPSGWIRWLLEQVEVPFQVVYAPRLDQGNLARDFDLLIFADGIIPASDSVQGGGGGGGGGRIPPREEVPAEYHERLGRVSVGITVPHLKQFLEAGGRVVTIGSSTNLAAHLKLPVASHLVERQPNGVVRALPREKFYVPASLLEVSVDSTAPTAWGLTGRTIVMFDESPVFRLDPGAVTAGTVRPIAWFSTASPLRSGWAWGQTYLEGGVAVAEAKVGKGTLYLFGPEITYRAQPAGTFKFLFNSILN